VNYPDGRFAVQFNGATLGFKVFDKIQTVQPGAIVDNKRLSAVLEQIKAHTHRPPIQRASSAGTVRRQRPPNNLEAPGLPSKGGRPTPWCYRSAGRSPPSRPPSRRGEVGFLRDREIYYDARRVVMAWHRQVAGADPFPIGSRSIAVSLQPAIPRRVAPPAEPASALPVPTISSSIPIPARQSNALPQLPCRDAVQVAPPRARRERECHLYFARRVTFLSCADIFQNSMLCDPPL